MDRQRQQWAGTLRSAALDVVGRTPAVGLDSVRWLRVRRATLDDAQAPEFRRDLEAVRDDVETRRGYGVGTAIALTVAVVLFALVLVALGAVMVELTSGMVSWLFGGGAR